MWTCVLEWRPRRLFRRHYVNSLLENEKLYTDVEFSTVLISCFFFRPIASIFLFLFCRWWPTTTSPPWSCMPIATALRQRDVCSTFVLVITWPSLCHMTWGVMPWPGNKTFPIFRIFYIHLSDKKSEVLQSAMGYAMLCSYSVASENQNFSQ